MDSDNESIVRVTPQEVSPKHSRIYGIKFNVAILILFYAFNFSGAVFQNQLISQTCSGIFGYNRTICEQLGSDNASEEKDIETQVQPYAAKIVMTRSFVEGLFSAFFGFIIGSWSDKHGRKPVLITSCLGFFLGSCINTFLTFLSTIYIINPWLYILGSIPIILSGGICALLTGTFSHIADITTIQQRPFKLAIIGAITSLGLMLGALSCGYVFPRTNATVVFTVSSSLLLFVVIYLCIFMEESVKQDEMDPTSKIRGLFKWALAKDVFQTCFERRPNFERAIIWCVMICMGLGVFVMEGNFNVFYLFVREKFNWTVQEYTTYNAVGIVCGVIGGILGIVVLRKVLKFSVTSLALLGVGSAIIDSLILSLAIYPWHLYFGTAISFMKGVISAMYRSILSNVVPPSDIGKIFSSAAFFETVMPLFSGPLYTYIYSQTITTYPGAFNVVSTGVFFICFLLLTFVYALEIQFPRITYGSLVR